MLGIEQIKEILPHREPFLMVDRVDELDPGKSGVGVKAVSGNEWYFQGHFAEKKVMPGVLILEAMAQLGGITVLSMPEMRGKLAFLGRIKNARFYDKVLPGDSLRLEAFIDDLKSNIGIGTGKASVEGKVVATCEFVFAISDPV
jgi:3-hydroxyacyl-[acyl-carrier-protein] dehydratase